MENEQMNQAQTAEPVQQIPQQQYQAPQQQYQAPAQEEVFDPADIEKNKTISALAYLLFFLPLIVCPESKFGRFHANQGLLLLIFGFGAGFISAMIPILGWFILLPLVSIGCVVFFIIGLINTLDGKAKNLPLFGKIRIIK